MSFLAHEKNGLLIKTSTVLSGVRHGFSTRTGGVSPAPWDSLNLGVGRGDDMDRVRENYRRFCAVLGTDEHRAVLSKQVHEDNVRHVTAETAEDIPWTLDGEYDPGAPFVEIGIEENGLTMMI